MRTKICESVSCVNPKCHHVKKDLICSWCGEPKSSKNILDHEKLRCPERVKNIRLDLFDNFDTFIKSIQYVFVFLNNIDKEKNSLFIIYKHALRSLNANTVLVQYPRKLYDIEHMYYVLNGTMWNNESQVRFIFIVFGSIDVESLSCIEIFKEVLNDTRTEKLIFDFYKDDNAMTKVPKDLFENRKCAFIESPKFQINQVANSICFNPAGFELLRDMFKNWGFESLCGLYCFANVEKNQQLLFEALFEDRALDELHQQRMKLIGTKRKRLVQKGKVLNPESKKRSCHFCNKTIAKSKFFAHKKICEFAFLNDPPVIENGIILLISFGSDGLERAKIFGHALNVALTNPNIHIKQNGRQVVDSKIFITTIHLDSDDLDWRTKLESILYSSELLNRSELGSLENRIGVFVFCDLDHPSFPLEIKNNDILNPDNVFVTFYNLQLSKSLDQWVQNVQRIQRDPNSLETCFLFSHPFDYMKSVPFMVQIALFHFETRRCREWFEIGLLNLNITTFTPKDYSIFLPQSTQ